MGVPFLFDFWREKDINKALLFNKIHKYMAEEEKQKTEEDVEKEGDVFDPNSDTCKTCGGCGGEE